jgi:hypothetical protein
MVYLWFDHPLIEAWLEARLRAELHRKPRGAAGEFHRGFTGNSPRQAWPNN